MLEDSSTRNTISALFWPHTEETARVKKITPHLICSWCYIITLHRSEQWGQNTWSLYSCWIYHSGCGWFVWHLSFSGLSDPWLTLRLLCDPGFGGWHCASMLSGTGDSGSDMRGHSGWHRQDCHHRRILSLWNMEMMWQRSPNILEKILIPGTPKELPRLKPFL